MKIGQKQKKNKGIWTSARFPKANLPNFWRIFAKVSCEAYL